MKLAGIGVVFLDPVWPCGSYHMMALVRIPFILCTLTVFVCKCIETNADIVHMQCIFNNLRTRHFIRFCFQLYIPVLSLYGWDKVWNEAKTMSQNASDALFYYSAYFNGNSYLEFLQNTIFHEVVKLPINQRRDM